MDSKNQLSSRSGFIEPSQHLAARCVFSYFRTMIKKTVTQLLEGANLRLTRTRKAIAQLLYEDGLNRHVSAEWVARELDEAGEKIALATVYNTLNSFVEAGLLRQIQAGGQAVIFDTNTDEHCHFLRESTGELIDIAPGMVDLGKIPEPPTGMRVKGWDVIIRVD